MRFKLGELVCFLTDQSCSLPTCYREHNRFFLCRQQPERWATQVCKLPLKTPVYGYVCEYDTSEVMMVSGPEFNKVVNPFLFVMLILEKEPYVVRVNELDKNLYRVIDSQTLEDRTGTRALLPPNF